MKRVIVDYSKLTNEILNLLVEKFPDGYDERDIIRFKNAKNETIEAVEVRTDDTIFLVKVSTKLADRIENYDEDEIIPVPETVALKELDLEEDEEEDLDENDSEKIDLDEDDDTEPSDTAYDEDEEED